MDGWVAGVAHAHIHTHTLTYTIHTHIHTHSRTRTHTLTHTLTHTHTRYTNQYVMGVMEMHLSETTASQNFREHIENCAKRGWWRELQGIGRKVLQVRCVCACVRACVCVCVRVHIRVNCALARTPKPPGHMHHELSLVSAYLDPYPQHTHTHTHTPATAQSRRQHLRAARYSGDGGCRDDRQRRDVALWPARGPHHTREVQGHEQQSQTLHAGIREARGIRLCGGQMSQWGG